MEFSASITTCANSCNKSLLLYLSISGVGGPSACVLFYWLTALSLCQRRTELGGEKLGCMLGERREESERSHGASLETDARTLVGKPQPHGDTQITRNGLS